MSGLTEGIDDPDIAAAPANRCWTHLAVPKSSSRAHSLTVLFLHSPRPTTPSPISAKQPTSSSSPWWSGPKGSRTSPSSPSTTRSSSYEQVDTHTHTHTPLRAPEVYARAYMSRQEMDRIKNTCFSRTVNLSATCCPRGGGGVAFLSGELFIP